MSLYLNNYRLTNKEILESFVVSKYGRRHLKRANREPQHKWGHRIIALIEFMPFLGPIASLLEFMFHSCLHKTSNFTDHSSEPDENFAYPSINQATVKRLTHTTQAGCNGLVDISAAKTIVASLNQKRSAGVIFEKTRLEHVVLGGTCTVMTLDLIHRFMKECKNCKSDLDQENLLIRLNNTYTQKSSARFRTKQMALNTIARKPDEPCDDFKMAKVNSLLKLKNLEVRSLVVEGDLKKDSKSLTEQIQKLANGVFFIRSLKHENNHKEEDSGHSLALFNFSNRSYFYDPNYGIYAIPKASQGESLFKKLKRVDDTFNVNELRIYQVSRAASIG